jgi:outer membrane protein
MTKRDSPPLPPSPPRGYRPRTALLAALVALASASLPLRAAPLRVGYVNTLTLLKKMPQSLAARKTLEHEFTPELDRIHKEEARLEAEEKHFKSVRTSLSLLQKTLERQKIATLVRRLRRHQRAYFEDLNLARDQVLANLQHLLIHAIHQYARQHRYDLVVGEGVYYAGPRIDITRKILAYLTTLERRRRG